jgi:DNA-binding response OmpR family regulator
MRILVVEDEHKIANSIKRGLEQEAYAVDVCYSGTDGYDLASTEEYDLIILDLMLPEISGIEICKRLRKEKIHIPILILTAKGQIGDRVKGLDAGADDYLTKPFAFEELLARIRALVRRPEKAYGEELSAKGLTLNTNTYEVKKNGKIINLSKKEFALLEFLLRNTGKLVSKDNIIAHVWNYDSDIILNTVEVYIGYLRKKIGEEMIKTIRGFGYKIDV